MRNKSVSDSSLKELIKNKKALKIISIGLGILWILILTWIISIPKYKLIFTLLILAITTIIPILIFMSHIDSEIKKRNSQNS
jgi:glucan phosphoethanolaminetransferase (alkaline phosphatase superfamily)